MTSTSFPAAKQTQLLNFIKELQLPPDVSTLFTTARNDRKNAVSQEDVDNVLRMYGSKLALLAQAEEKLGLGSHGGTSQLMAPQQLNDLSAFAGRGAAALLQDDEEFGRGGAAGPSSSDNGSGAAAAAAAAADQRCSVSDGVRHESGSGFYISADALPAPAFVCDHLGVVREWNAAIATLTGWSAAAVQGKRLVDAGVVSAEAHTSLLMSAQADTALRMHTSDERLLELHFRITRLVDVSGLAEGGGSSDGLLAVGVDATAIVGRAAASSQEVHDLKRLIDCANAPIFGINATALITEWNKKATQITGRSKWEVVGRRLDEFVGAADRASVVEVLDNALKGKETANFEFPLYTKEGTRGKHASERVEILLNAATRRDANNQIVGVVGVGQDITELNAGKAELARVANDLKMLIESANAPIFGIDTRGRVTEWNKKAAEITGYTAQEMLSHTLIDAATIKEEFKGSVRQVLTHALNGIESTNFELPLYSRSGTRVELSLNATTRHSAKGEVVGVVMVGQVKSGLSIPSACCLLPAAYCLRPATYLACSLLHANLPATCLLACYLLQRVVCCLLRAAVACFCCCFCCCLLLLLTPDTHSRVSTRILPAKRISKRHRSLRQRRARPLTQRANSWPRCRTRCARR